VEWHGQNNSQAPCGVLTITPSKQARTIRDGALTVPCDVQCVGEVKASVERLCELMEEASTLAFVLKRVLLVSVPKAKPAKPSEKA
jgi:hypothetical protein